MTTWLLSLLTRFEVQLVPAGPGLTASLGVVFGLLSAEFELTLLPRIARRTTSPLLLLARVAFYTAVPFATIVLTGALLAAEETGVSVVTAMGDPTFARAIGSRGVLLLLALILVSSLLGNYFRQVRLMLGPGTQFALFVGRYARPVMEDRVFLFVDLTDSTGLAERLGPAAFHDLKNDFFLDVAEPVLATRGEIYQYVGDEVVITWPVRAGRPAGDAVLTFRLLQARLDSRRAHYESRYGVVPTFKAGVHSGPVVTAEVGDVKKDIVHTGDTVNTAARIVGACRPLRAKLLVSEAAADVLGHPDRLPDGLVAEPVGTVALRGKAEAVPLLSVRALHAADVVT